MTRRELSGVVALGLLGTGATARGQNFGRVLEQAARDTIRGRLDLGPAAQPRQSGEPYTIKTSDGWTLTAHRYKPGMKPDAARLPVVLAHGLTYSAGFWDLEPSVSFARWLSQRGWDVWAVDWRGCGASQKWVFRLEDAPEALFGGALRRATGGKLNPTSHATLDPKYANWTLDDHIDRDLPAFMRLVGKSTGAPRVHWVGHSMGGIIPLCHLSKYPNPGIDRLATVGSQLTMAKGGTVPPFVEQMLVAREQQLTGGLQPAELAARTQESLQNLFFNLNHVSRSVYQALGSDRTDVPSIGLMKQYGVLAREGELWNAGRTASYARAAKNIQVPILMSCGQVDAFAPPPTQKFLYDNVGSTDKTAVVYGRARGFSADSGHDDALVGLTSMQEIYPVIERWLNGERV